MTPKQLTPIKQTPDTKPELPDEESVVETEEIEEAPAEIDLAWDHHDPPKKHTTNWYLILGASFVAMMLISILLLKDWLFAVVLVVLMVALVVYLRRPNFTIKYALSQQGVFIDARLHPFSDFKSFGLQKNLDQSYTVALIPHKRFAQSLVLDFPDDLGEEIVDYIGARLPMQKIEMNLIDKIIQQIGL